MAKKYRTKDKIRCRCPNPLHFKWGTYKKNNKQTYKDGNISECIGAKGENNKASKLEEHEVIDIYKRAWLGERQQNIADEYGVFKGQVSKIKCGTRWGWLTKDIDPFK